jgi:hypothetical protein
MNNLIKTIQTNHIETLKSSIRNGSVNNHSQIFECDSLKDYMDVDIRKSPEFKSFFTELKEMKGPVLYSFRILSDNEHSEIRNKLSDYKRTKEPRGTSAMRKYTVDDSRYLYVGKVKKDISGRIITHLGYNNNKDTSGLQLYHWVKGLNLKLELNLIELIPEMADIMEIIELKAAQNYHPIIGKH